MRKSDKPAEKLPSRGSKKESITKKETIQS